MKKRFKKIYIEITNRCNLNCSFCGKNKRDYRDMSLLEFELVINKIKKYTDYIYLHVKGEPLLYDNLDSLLSICDNTNIKVNITTNGVFLKEKLSVLMNHFCIRQINISLHSENNKKNYFLDVFSSGKVLSTKMFISYRIWDLKEYKLNKKSTEIVNKIIEFYNLSPVIVDKLYNDKNIKIASNTFVNKENIFTWPDVDNDILVDGFCYGLKTHIAILSNGDIVPCCLDANGEIKLGNIFEDSLDDVLNGDIYKSLLKSFKDNKAIHPLCKSCNFKNRFNK